MYTLLHVYVCVVQAQTNGLEAGESIDTSAVIDEAMKAIVPQELPSPHPPRGRKRDLYQDPSFFEELDEDVFKVRAPTVIPSEGILRQAV